MGKNRGGKKPANSSQTGRRLTVADARELGRPVIYLPADAGDVRQIRDGLGISQAELAKLSGVSRTAIADLETERYAMSAFDGIELFTALVHAKSSSAGAPEYREQAKQAALKLIAFQRENSLRKLEKLEKERCEVEAWADELDSKEARLREL